MPFKRDPHIPRKTVLLAVCTVFFLLAVPASALDLPMNSPPASTPSIPKGDSVTVHGTATGHPSNGLRIWLVGNNYATVHSESVNADNTFSYELKPSETQNLASGQYFVLVQHPMMNGEFDVSYNADTGEVTRRVDNTVLFRLTGSGRLQASDGASALVNAVGSQDIDDTFSAVSFFIAPPQTSFDPVGDRTVGDSFTISGSTNLAIGDALMIEVISSSFKPTTKMQSGEFSGASGTIYVEDGSGGLHRWSFPVDTTGWKPDEYIVTVSAVLQDVTASTTFALAEYTPPVTQVTASPVPTIPAPAKPVPVDTTMPVTPASPPGIGTIVAGFMIAVLVSFRNCGKQ